LRKWKLWYWGRLRGYLYHFLEFMKVSVQREDIWGDKERMNFREDQRP